MEDELETLILKAKSRAATATDVTAFYPFFSKAIQRNVQIEITPFIRDNLGFLSTVDKGMIWPLALQALHNFKPNMIVPPLDMQQSFSVTLPRPLPSLSARSKELSTTFHVTSPYQPRTVRLVPVVTTREILPKLAAMPPGQFFYCTQRKRKMAKQPDAMNYKIHTKKLPLIPMDPDTHTLTQNGMFHCSPDNHGEYTRMKDLVRDKETVYMASVLPVFQNWYQNKAFIKWLYKLRMKRFRRIQNGVLNECPFGHTEFFELVGDIRQTVFAVFTQCHPLDREKPMETFENLVANSNVSLKEMREKVAELDDLLVEKIAHFCKQVRSIALLLRSDYDILKKIGAIPKALAPYVVEREVNAPSITKCRLRSQLLYQERKRAFDRKEYLPRFYIMVKLFMRDFFVQQLHDTLREFYFRFTEQPPSTSHMIELVLDPQEGLLMSPTLEEFLNWFNVVDKSIKDIFLAEHVQMGGEVLAQIFPDTDCPTISFIESVALSQEMEDMKNEAIKMITDAYADLTSSSQESCGFLKKLQVRLDELDAIADFNDADLFCSVADELFDLLRGIDNLQRVVNHGSLFSDMKRGKTSALEHMRNTTDRIRKMGITKSKELFDDITHAKDRYIKSVSLSKMFNQDENSPELLEMKQQIRDLCAKYMPITETILQYWSDTAIDMDEQYGAVQDILSLVSATPRPPKSKPQRKVVRRIVKKKKE